MSARPEPGIEVISVRAGDGDCFLIRCLGGDRPFNVLVDGGRARAFANLKAYLTTLEPGDRRIDLLIVTHIDADHIAGILSLGADEGTSALVDEVWFNDAARLPRGGTSLGTAQGDRLARLIRRRGWAWNRSFDAGPVVRRTDGRPLRIEPAPGVVLHLLGPTIEGLARLAGQWPADEIVDDADDATEVRGAIAMGGTLTPDVEDLCKERYDPDPSVSNGSSIAFLLTYAGLGVLATADSHAEDLVEAIEMDFGGVLAVDLATLPHHGAATNTSPAFARTVDAKAWLVSTTGGRNHHPDARSVARILGLKPPKRTTIVHFNSRHAESACWDDPEIKRTYDFETRYPAEGSGWHVVRLPREP